MDILLVSLLRVFVGGIREDLLDRLRGVVIWCILFRVESY